MTARPFPPADIATRVPIIETLAAGTIIYRFYSNGFDPVYFPEDTGGRLNAPDGAYGTLYAARSTGGAFAETFLRNAGKTLIDDAIVKKKGMVELRLVAELYLACLHGPGLAILGATAEVTHAGLSSYDLSQAWSKSLHDHPAGIDGIAYRSRHDDDEICFAIFDRAAPKLALQLQQAEIDQPWFWDLVDRYRVSYLP